jgi:hypothetical protein
MPSLLNANECNVLKYGRSSSVRLNFLIALSLASYAAFCVKAKYPTLSGSVSFK